jgi:hypothetical protein
VVYYDDLLEFVRGLGEYDEDGGVFRVGGKIFLIVHGGEPLRVEVRTDGNLRKLLMERYESVMGSRGLGRGGVEVVCVGQLTGGEVLDLVRLSYDLSKG